MNKRIIAAIVVVVAIIVVAAVLYISITKRDKEVPSSYEYVGGKYNATLSYFESGGSQIEYTDEAGKHSEQYFETQMRPGLDWIKNNTPEDAAFLCWWDYGHAIKGYAERNVTVRNPSHEWINMIQKAREDPSFVKEFDPNERLIDVAKALTTSNSTETLQIMEKYGAAYIVVYKEDVVGKAYWMCQVAGLNPWDYHVQNATTYTLNDAGRQMMISRLLDNRDTGFALLYQDAAMKVYGKT